MRSSWRFRLWWRSCRTSDQKHSAEMCLASVPLNMSKSRFTVGFFSGINLMAAVAAFVLVWAYQKKVEEEETLASWAVFFCVAVSFSVFGFSTWNPQWVLLMAPFLVLNIFMNENGNLLLMITNILYAGDVYFLQPEYGGMREF